MWKEEEAGTMRVNAARFKEAKETGANTLAVGCPFCMTMLSDASKTDGGSRVHGDFLKVSLCSPCTRW
jgi:heterodisulfide reductase subunit D